MKKQQLVIEENEMESSGSMKDAFAKIMSEYIFQKRNGNFGFSAFACSYPRLALS